VQRLIVEYPFANSACQISPYQFVRSSPGSVLTDREPHVADWSGKDHELETLESGPSHVLQLSAMPNSPSEIGLEYEPEEGFS
jgi:hypothetical protein